MIDCVLIVELPSGVKSLAARQVLLIYLDIWRAWIKKISFCAFPPVPRFWPNP